MDSALSIVEGRDGILRDIYGRPMVMIYDSDLNRALARDASESSPQARRCRGFLNV